MSAAAASPLNPHRALVASSFDEKSSCAGQLSVRDQTGESFQIRVLQHMERQAETRSVRWVFSEADDTFQIELRHGRVTGTRRLYVNRREISGTHTPLATGSKQDFTLNNKDDLSIHKACVVITKERGLDFTYRTLPLARIGCAL